MAFWNAVDGMDVEKHEIRACESALRQVGALEVLKKEWKPRGWPQCEIRCGIHTDDVLCGNIGSPERLKYGLVGDGVNLASRLEGLCKRYRINIMISENVYVGVRDVMLCRKIDYVIVKGKEEPTWLYELVTTMKRATAADKSAASRFNALFALAETGQFHTCLVGCQDYLKDHPGDGPCELLIAKCEMMAGEKEVASSEWTLPPTQLDEK
eukprot:CAMPEP_0113889834 /NCGR_PEP_ID=MMETSP0780_2-20120614/13760_1 /TAXON_ID=652834 /ORGANISM="Palpitomonas bilix" /LENGTH=210 /DNA_ID=CAMNT_0000879063 /DNA_START=1 /DNA_END=633 /DNA_ORIENTATION=- /assembly_acc=CAM_ASM_000599